MDDYGLSNGSGQHDLDGGSLPFGTSTDLLASLDPYDGDVSGWLNDLLDAPEEDASKGEADEVSRRPPVELELIARWAELNIQLELAQRLSESSPSP